jgi:hypothetical protein
MQSLKRIVIGLLLLTLVLSPSASRARRWLRKRPSRTMITQLNSQYPQKKFKN